MNTHVGFGSSGFSSGGFGDMSQVQKDSRFVNTSQTGSIFGSTSQTGSEFGSKTQKEGGFGSTSPKGSEFKSVFGGHSAKGPGIFGGGASNVLQTTQSGLTGSSGFSTASTNPFTKVGEGNKGQTSFGGEDSTERHRNPFGGSESGTTSQESELKKQTLFGGKRLKYFTFKIKFSVFFFFFCHGF